jgi:ergothioneine biosynthesis protein EgtB
MNNSHEIMTENITLQRTELFSKFNEIRRFSELLCLPLETEDYVTQSMPDASPAKWHLAHTSWFFEAFILSEALDDYKSPFPIFNFIFNSYYVQIGERYTRAERGLLSRPTVKQIYAYRDYISQQISGLVESSTDDVFMKYSPLIEVGINHEQQHQELIVTDIKHMFSCNPLYPVYKKSERPKTGKPGEMRFKTFQERIYYTGHNGDGFSYDNERPQHKKYLKEFSIGSRLITNAEYLNFIADNGYNRDELWLSDGIATVRKEKWNAPLYWIKDGNEWYNFTLSGLEKLNPHEPVCHVSFYEADAFARWSNCRLPLEEEWEAAAPDEIKGNFSDNMILHPLNLREEEELNQFYGDVWEWTASAYLGYPGFKTPPGALGEYNGKFMSGQMVLRGGSCATHSSHIRKTYRNFFPPHSRWQFTGIRLSEEIK